MGFKLVPFQKPYECWAEPGHIFMKDWHGVHDYPTTLQESIPVQVNKFTSDNAMWVLYKDGLMFVGNKENTYQTIRIADGVLLACGSWNKPFHEWEPCGVVSGLECLVDIHDHRTIMHPHDGSVFVLKEPAYYFDMIQAAYCAETAEDDVPIVITERGLVDYVSDGTWFPSRAAQGPDAVLRVQC